MRHETRLKLERQIRIRRLKIAGIAVAIISAVVGGFLLVDLDSHETKIRVAGTVESVAVPAQKGALDGLEVSVKLEDGRHVRVLTLKSRDPHVGDPIQVTEHRHLTGRTTFTFH